MDGVSIPAASTIPSLFFSHLTFRIDRILVRIGHVWAGFGL